MRKLKLILRILSIALTVLLAVLLISNIYTICMRTFTDEENPKFFGFSSAVIISGSMSDTIEVNDLVICHEQKDYAAGDIITFVSRGGSLVTHRITGISDSGFITQGDANNTPDRDPVSERDIVGKVVFIIPKIGLFIEFIRTPFGLMCLTFTGLLILAIPSFIDRRNGQGSNDANFQQNGGNNDGSENDGSEKKN